MKGWEMFSDFKTKADLERIGYKLKEKDLSLNKTIKPTFTILFCV